MTEDTEDWLINAVVNLRIITRQNFMSVRPFKIIDFSREHLLILLVQDPGDGELETETVLIVGCWGRAWVG